MNDTKSTPDPLLDPIEIDEKINESFLLVWAIKYKMSSDSFDYILINVKFAMALKQNNNRDWTAHAQSRYDERIVIQVLNRIALEMVNSTSRALSWGVVSPITFVSGEEIKK